MTFKLDFKSNLDAVNRKLEQAERRQRVRAAQHLKKALKATAVGRFGAESDITKGVGTQHKHADSESLVGMGPPAYAAHLIEFGTDLRYKSDGRATGRVAAMPFVFPTFARESAEVVAILSEEWF